MGFREDFVEYVESNLDRAVEQTGVDIDYSIGDGVEFSAEIYDDSTGLTGELSYEAGPDSTWSQGASGELCLKVYDDEDVLYERSVDASLEGSSLDNFVLMRVPVEGQTPKADGKLDESVEQSLNLMQDFVSSPSILRYEQMIENSTPINNNASRKLRDNVRNEVNGDYPSSPVREFGKGLVSPRHPVKDMEEAREELENSEEADKWRELGEKLQDGEISKEAFSKVVETLDRNPEKDVTNFAV